MPRRYTPKPGDKIASIPDRIRGSIAVVLTIASWTGANLTDDKQWQMTFMIAGFCYFLTAIAYVFDNMD